MAKHDDPPQPTHRPDGISIRLGSAEDVAAFYYGRALMLKDARVEETANRHRWSEPESEPDLITLQELQLMDELNALADNHAMRASLVSRHLLKSSHAAVRRLGKRLRDRLKQRADELGDRSEK